MLLLCPQNHRSVVLAQEKFRKNQERLGISQDHSLEIFAPETLGETQDSSEVFSNQRGNKSGQESSVPLVRTRAAQRRNDFGLGTQERLSGVVTSALL